MIKLIAFIIPERWFYYSENNSYYFVGTDKKSIIVEKDYLYVAIPGGEYEICEQEFPDLNSIFQFLEAETVRRYVKNRGALPTSEELKEQLLQIISSDEIEAMLERRKELFERREKQEFLRNILKAKNITEEQKSKINKYLHQGNNI